MTDEVNRILNAGDDLYRVLGLEKTCTQDDIKKSYRRLAQAVHPDRNKDERATEAFQSISHAYQVLSDENKRRDYDLYGSEKPQTQQRTYGYTSADPHELTPEELFNMFFGFSPQGHHFQYYTNQPNFARRPRYHQQMGNPMPHLHKKDLIRYAIFFFILIFLSGNIQNLFSNPLSADNLGNIISLEKPDEPFVSKISPRYHAKYYVTQNGYANLMRRIGRRGEVENALGGAADKLYKEEVLINCELEKNNGNYEGKWCSKAKSL